MIRISHGDIYMLKETKLNEVNFNYVSLFLPSFFNFNVAYKQADGSKGGLLIAWKMCYDLLNSWTTKNTVTTILKNKNTEDVTQFTNIYGPSVDIDKPAFIEELKMVAGLVQHRGSLRGILI